MIRKNLRRPADFLARYGGEEFVALLPETGLPGSKMLAERIRMEVEGMEIHHERSIVRLTISIGVACCYIENGIFKEAMLLKADGALYQAKSRGRNQVALAN